MNLDETELPEILFNIVSPYGCTIRTTINQWVKICNKHSELFYELELVIASITNAELIRRSRFDPDVYLSYKKFKKYWIVAVFRRINGSGFLITAYLTDRIKAGEQVWQK